MQRVTLRLVQGDHSWDLASVDAGSADADHLGWVSWTFDLPAGVVPGPAELAPDNAQAVRITIR
jgi:hypothetical protein